MEVLEGKVVNRTPDVTEEPAREVELFTNPVAVHRIKLGFGAVPVVQLALSAVCGGVLWYMTISGGKMQVAAEEIIRRIIGG